MKNKMLEFTGLVLEIREKSCKVNVDGVIDWIPDSITDYLDDPKKGKDCRFEIPEWLAEKKEFI